MMEYATQLHHAQLMNRVYRHTRHVYDVTRKFYLFGRDRLITRIADDQPQRVLEVGCGTGRNLIRLHHRRPGAHLFGLDISSAMLETAERSLRRAGAADQITLRLASADDFHYQQTFDSPEPFDAVFFSYSLTMMPMWHDALRCAWDSVAVGGRLYLVDFCDQAGLPRFFARGLQWWLSLFHVKFRRDHIEMLYEIASGESGEDKTAHDDSQVTIETLTGRYAYLAIVRKV